MQKLLIQLQKNKYVMIFLCFVLSLIIMFNVALIAAQPVNAVVGVDDAALMVLGSVCLGLAMNIAITNPNWGNTLSGLYDALSTTCKTYVNEAALSVALGYTLVYNWQVERYEALTDEIIAYFQENSFTEVPGTITPSNSSGKIGFTSDTGFTMYYPNGTNSVTYFLPSGQLKIFAVATKSDFPSVPAVNNISSTVNAGYYVINSDGFGFYSPQYNSVQQNTYDSYWTPYRYDEPDRAFLKCNKSNFGVLQLSTYISQYGASFFMDSLQNVYELKAVNNVYGFYNVSNSALYNNLTFSSSGAAKNWFRRSLGFAVSGDTDVPAYSPPVTDNGVTFDYDTAVSSQSANVSGAVDGSISTVIPGTAADLGTLADSPGAVLNPAVAETIVAVYPSDLPVIDKSPALWLQKFPFCVPFDLARIISDLQAPPEVPVFHILVIPEDSFGLDNDDIFVDIDFSYYSDLVAILRFFISLAFVVWLILITRMIIKG